MAAKNSSENKKRLGSKISRGTDNAALTPSGNDGQRQPDEVKLETIISAMSEGIISLFKESNDKQGAIISSLNGLNSITSSFADIVDPLNAINDKLIAMLGVMYGFKANPTMNSSQYMSKLGNIKQEFTSNSGIYSVLSDIHDMLGALNTLGPSQPSDNPVITPAATSSYTEYTTNNTNNSNITNTNSNSYSSSNQSNSNTVNNVVNNSVSNNAVNTTSNAYSSSNQSNNTTVNNVVNNSTNSISNTSSTSVSDATTIYDMINDALICLCSIDDFIRNTDFVPSEISHDITIKGENIDSEAFTAIAQIFRMSFAREINLDSVNKSVDELQSLSKRISKIPVADTSFIDSVNTMYDTIEHVGTKNASLRNMNLDAIVNMSEQMEQASAHLKKIDKVPSNALALADTILSLATKIKKLNVESASIKMPVIDFGNLDSDLQRLASIGERTKKDIEGVSNILSTVASLGNYDKKAFDSTTYALRKIGQLTERPGMLTSIGLSSTGLIWIILDNLSKLASAKDDAKTNIAEITEFLSAVASIHRKLSKDDAQEMRSTLYILCGVVNTIQNLFDEYGKIKYERRYITTLEKIREFLVNANNLSDTLDFKHVTSMIPKIALLNAALIGLSITFVLLKPIGAQSKDMVKAVTSLRTLLVNINAAMQTPNLKGLSEFVKAMAAINGALALAAVGMPLAMVGLWMMEKEMGLVDRIVTRINKIKDIEKGKKQMMQIATVIGVSAGVMMLAAAAGIFVTTHLVDIIGFTVALGVFMLGVIWAYRGATRGMKAAEVGAAQFAALVGVSAAILLLGGAIIKEHPGLIVGSLAFTLLLSSFILFTLGAYNLATRGITTAEVSAVQFAVLVGISAATLLIGGGLMAACPELMVTVPLFGLILAGFITLVTFAYTRTMKSITLASKVALELGLLIGISAAALLLGGGLIAAYQDMIWSVPLFGLILYKFISLTTLAYASNAAAIGESMKYALSFGALIAISAATLLIGGSLFANDRSLITGTIVFGATLGVFMLLVTAAYGLGAKMIGNAMKYAVSFAALVAVSAAALLLGGMAILDDPSIIWAAPVFGLILGAFVWGISWVYTKVAKNMKTTMIIAQGFLGLVAVSGAVLMLGAYFMKDWTNVVGALAFGVALGVFIVAVGGAYRLMSGREMQKAMPTALMLMGLITVSAGIMMLGAYVMKDEQMRDGAWAFVITTGLFIGGMAIVLKYINKMNIKDLAMGALKLALVGALMFGLTYVMGYMVDVANRTDFGSLWALYGSMIGMIVITGVIAYAAAALLTNPVFYIGLGNIALIAGATWLLVETMEKMLEASKKMDELDEVDFSRAGEVIDKFMGLADKFNVMGDWKKIAKLKIAQINTLALASSISAIAYAIKNISNLTLTEYDENGKAIGVRHLNDKDFITAAVNVETIISTLGDSIIKTYEKNPGMFSAGRFKDLIGAETPFGRVCRSCATMGNMISLIAQGVKEYADLTVPEYDENGNKTGRLRRLTTQDFAAAAINVERLISILGQAVMDTYAKNPDLFSAGSWGDFFKMDTPFTRVVKSCSNMGAMIASIAQSVKEYAELMVPVYDEKGNKTNRMRKLTEADFTDAATNISKVLTTLGYAIIDVYNKNPEIFDDTSVMGWLTGGKPENTKFGKVVFAMQGAGKLVYEAAQGIAEVVKLTEDVSNESTQKQISDKVANVVGLLANSIYKLATDENSAKAFEDTSWFGQKFGQNAASTPVAMVVNSLTGSSELIREAVDLINDVDKIKVPKNIGDKVGLILGAMANAIAEQGNKDAFKDTSLWGKLTGGSAEDTPAARVQQTLKGSSKLINEALSIAERVAGLTLDAKTISESVQTIMSSVPNAILSSTIYSETHKDFWNSKDASKKLSSISTVYKSMVNLVSEVVNKYDEIGKLMADEGISSVIQSLSSMLCAIPNAVTEANEKLSDATTLSNVIDAYSKYELIMQSMLSIYKNAWTTFSSFGENMDIKSIKFVGDGMMEMATQMKALINEISGDGIDILKTEVAGFSEAMQTYQTGVTDLADTFDVVAPKVSEVDINSLDDVIANINREIANTPDIGKFKEETNALRSYIQTINTIDLNKVSSLTNLAYALTVMSTKLGSLDELTEVLANKVAAVLKELSDRMDESAKTINTAERIQNERHIKINNSINTLKQLMDKPVNINLSYEDVAGTVTTPSRGASYAAAASVSDGKTRGDRRYGSGTSSSTSSSRPATNSVNALKKDTTSTAAPSNTAAASTSSTPAPEVSMPYAGTNFATLGGRGLSEAHIRSLARFEIAQALEGLKANNDQRGGGSRTGALQN